MRGPRDERIAAPLARGESRPRMRGVLGWVRASVHVDRAIRATERSADRVGHDVQVRIELFGDAEPRWSPERVLGRVAHADVLGYTEQRRVVRERARTPLLVERNAEIVDKRRARGALGGVLDEAEHVRQPRGRLIPEAGDVGLRGRAAGQAERGDRDDEDTNDVTGFASWHPGNLQKRRVTLP